MQNEPNLCKQASYEQVKRSHVHGSNLHNPGSTGRQETTYNTGDSSSQFTKVHGKSWRKTDTQETEKIKQKCLT